ncbi:MAG: hypothetical protein ACXWPS_21620 [Ktedonobacteraceae bacterium]
MPHLERSYIFEFAGMPQSGKTTVKEILVHYLKRMEYPVVEYNGGSRHSRLPIYRMPIGELNEKLAYQIENFVRIEMERQNSAPNIYIFDRGLMDRCIFTDALVQANKVAPKLAEKLYTILTAPELLEKLDGVFIFTTSPQTALDREYADKLVKHKDVRSQGDVMNERFLSEMRFAAIDWQDKLSRRSIGHLKHVKPIDTTPIDTDMQMVAKHIFESINNWYPELQFQLTSAK